MQPDPQDTLIQRNIDNINSVEYKPKTNFALPKAAKFGEFWSLVLMIVLGVGIGLGLSQYVFRPYRVVGESMSQTLHSGDRLIVNRLGRSIAGFTGNDFLPKRHDIVVFESPFNGDLLVKRIIGLPGDRVVVEDGSITIFNSENPNGFNPDQDQYYVENLPPYTFGSVDVTVAEGTVFVSGDNRTANGSSDSRNELGLVPLENMVGSVAMRILPLDQARFY